MHWLIPKALVSPLVVAKVDPAAAGARHDPLAAARRRGALAKAELLNAEGGALSADAFAGRLGLSPGQVEAYRTAKSIIGLPVASGRYLYPSFQVTGDGLTVGLKDVISAFKVDDPWMQAHFFLTADHRLQGRRPIDVLRAGDVTSVVSAAAAFGEQGAA